MASTLSQQLAAVRAAGVATSSGIQATRRGGQQRPSILFDGKEAADVDTFTVHQLACEGLERLAAHEPRLGPFRSTLFSDESQSFVRELQTREVNQQLDASLQTCLLYLSPFVGEEDGARVAEYLVRRYAVHAHCAPALLTCFLPYHDRPVFHRVVRLLRLDAGGPVKALACWLPLLRPWLLSSTASSEPP
ncbi:U3 small nucleolar RNA-associated protein 10, partial [Nannochloropsis gaditana CCMP526]|uniref:U3 small nucleolar RNA-associated protein 10 n=1 Tax=Nannochloropsis gaditana (strain CCMP526) TaxID=1093141 RepID=UPI00029F7E5F